jgi:beta-galactosidase
VDGSELLTSPIVPSFWKAMNDNQMRSQYGQQTQPWRAAAAERKLIGLQATVSGAAQQVSVRFGLPVGEAGYELTYGFQRDGQVTVSAAYTPGKGKASLLPRFGVTWAMPQQYDRIAWYGRGPHETYWDRQTGGEIAVYKSTIEDWWFPYVRAQDTGNRTGTRWMTLTNAAGVGLKITGAAPLNVSALPFTVADLEAALHPHELPRRDFNTVFVDYQLHGVGGDNSWGALTHSQYTLPSDKPYSLNFTVAPLRAGK